VLKNLTLHLKLFSVLFNDSRTLIVQSCNQYIGADQRESCLNTVSTARVKDLPEPLEIRIPLGMDLQSIDDATVFECLYLKDESEWSTEGCSFRKQENGVAICDCLHLSAFAVAVLTQRDSQTLGDCQETLKTLYDSTEYFTFQIFACIMWMIVCVFSFRSLQKELKKSKGVVTLKVFCFIGIGPAALLRGVYYLLLILMSWGKNKSTYDIALNPVRT